MLRMLGMLVEGPTNIFCDNDAAVKSAANPKSSTKKKHAGTAQHQMREVITTMVIAVNHEMMQKMV